MSEQMSLPGMENKELGGVKNDQGKSRTDLLSSVWILGVGRILAYGSQKYSAHNWRKGLAISRCVGAALRHTLQFLGGEDNDPETGESHLLHASCSLMFAYELHLTQGEKVDDRWKSPSITKPAQ